MTALTAMYVVLLGQKGWLLLQAEATASKVIGGLILLFPVLALWAIARELRFGLRVEKLGAMLEQAGKWPHFDFDLRASGRPTKESAAREFERVRDLVQNNEDDWQAWFALGLAYDATGDKTRARAAMRKALALYAKAPH